MGGYGQMLNGYQSARLAASPKHNNRPNRRSHAPRAEEHPFAVGKHLLFFGLSGADLLAGDLDWMFAFRQGIGYSINTLSGYNKGRIFTNQHMRDG